MNFRKTNVLPTYSCEIQSCIFCTGNIQSWWCRRRGGKLMPWYSLYAPTCCADKFAMLVQRICCCPCLLPSVKKCFQTFWSFVKNGGTIGMGWPNFHKIQPVWGYILRVSISINRHKQFLFLMRVDRQYSKYRLLPESQEIVLWDLTCGMLQQMKDTQECGTFHFNNIDISFTPTLVAKSYRNFQRQRADAKNFIARAQEQRVFGAISVLWCTAGQSNLLSELCDGLG